MLQLGRELLKLTTRTHIHLHSFKLAMASFAEAGDADDAAFLSAIAEAEADGLRRLSQGDSKRQHVEPAESISSSVPTSSHGAGYGDFGHGEAASKRSRVEPEGEYMAALRGNHSETWQAMAKARLDAKPRYGAFSSNNRSTNLGSDGGGAQGASMTPSSRGPDSTNIPGQVQVPQKNCPCGGGACLVLTSNTEKNPGRQFYRCPLRKEEGHCGFFEWCDGMTSSSQGQSKDQGSNYAKAETIFQPGQVQVPQKNCPCGGGACFVLTANTEKNPGRQFYRCPLRKEEGQCGFFEWCDGMTSSSQGLSKDQGSNYAKAETVFQPGQVQVPQKNCPCGGGACLVLTANTEKNPGRQFYKCPLRKEEGQCGFFEWCDGMASSIQGLSKDQGSSCVNAEFPCPCGAGPCVRLTSKTEKNMGRQFYRCPLNQGEGSCNFFKWCDECVPASGATAPAYGGSAFRERLSMSNVATGQCHKCGMDGHWAKDCSSGVPNASPKGYGSTMRTGQVGIGMTLTCFKCNQVGHSANNCSSQQFGYGKKGALTGFNRQGGENSFSRGFANASGYGSQVTGRDVGGVRSASSGGCFKCGSEDHWSNNCPNMSNIRHSSYGGGTYGQASLSGRSEGSGSCYKCGGQGHYANECRADG